MSPLPLFHDFPTVIAQTHLFTFFPGPPIIHMFDYLKLPHSSPHYLFLAVFHFRSYVSPTSVIIFYNVWLDINGIQCILHLRRCSFRFMKFHLGHFSIALIHFFNIWNTVPKVVLMILSTDINICISSSWFQLNVYFSPMGHVLSFLMGTLGPGTELLVWNIEYHWGW